MATTVTPLPSALYPAGATPFSPITVPLGAEAAKIQLGRASLISGSLVAGWSLEFSDDSGASWTPWGEATTVGGVGLSESSFTVPLPSPSNALRQLRGQVTMSEAATTLVTVAFSP